MHETQETQVWSLDWEDPLQKEMTAYSSIFAWKIPWTVAWELIPWGHKELDMTERLSAHTHTHTLRITEQLLYECIKIQSAIMKFLFYSTDMIDLYVYIYSNTTLY